METKVVVREIETYCKSLLLTFDGSLSTKLAMRKLRDRKVVSCIIHKKTNYYIVNFFIKV